MIKHIIGFTKIVVLFGILSVVAFNLGYWVHYYEQSKIEKH